MKLRVSVKKMNIKEIENLCDFNSPSIWGYPEIKLILLLQRINPEMKILILTDTGINLKENYGSEENLDIRIPKKGQFINGKPIREQIEITPDELDKYDLVLTLRELPDEEKDRAIVEHLFSAEDLDFPIKKEDFDKHITRARELKIDNFSDDTKDIVLKFYLSLRKKPHYITRKELYSIYKLAESHAKLRLSNIVQKEDVEQATYLMKYMLMQTCFNEDKNCFDARLIR